MSSIPPPAGGFGFGGPAPLEPPPARRFSRNTVIVGGVLLFHAVALWGLQTGLLRRVAEVVVPAELLSEIITPPAPKVEPPPPEPRVRPQPVRQPVVKKAPTPPPPAPQPVAIADPTPSPNAPAGVLTPQPPAPLVAAPVAPPALPAPVRVELPSSDADYLQNPKPAYPPMSKRLGEQGKVLVHVLIGADGSAQKAEVRQSSGYDRLDQAAINTVLKWRYAPGKRGGVAEAMWFNVPIIFVLE